MVSFKKIPNVGSELGLELQKDKNIKKSEEQLSDTEKIALKRAKKSRKKEAEETKKKQEKEKKPSIFIKLSSQYFYNFSMQQLAKGRFKRLRKELIEANLDFVPAAYISLIFFSTVVALAASFLLIIFFSFFSITVNVPFIVPVHEAFSTRILKVFWLIIFLPAVTFLFAYFYPSMERRSIETRINQELPFAALNMSAISNSLVETSKIFNIIIETKEYPYLEKEFVKLLNEINIYGYDLVTALKDRTFNSPSKKLSELYNGLATTITSGGNLPEFFEKRAQTLLFDYRLEREKQGKSAETFMDIYISVVIAAPMMLMLILMMMRISGVGISLSTDVITLIMISGVSLINILFLTFIHLKQPQR